MSPKGHFCTLSLLRRNKAASWDEPKKKRGAGSPPRTLPLPHLMFVLRAACRHKPLWLQPPPPPPPMAPLRRLFGIAFPFLLNHTAVLFTVRPGHLIHQMENLLGCPWIWFGDDQEGKKIKRRKKKTPRSLSGFLCRFCRVHCSVSQQRLLLALERWKGDISLHFGEPQHAHGIIVKYNLARTLQQGLLQQCCTSETNLFSWSLSLWRGCKCYLSFSIKNTAGCAICLAQPSLSSPMPFCADHFTWQFARIFYTLILVNISAFFF